MPVGLLCLVAIVELAAIGLTGWLLVTRPGLSSGELVTAGVIGGLGLLHTEVARPVERTRWRLTGELHVELTSVWTFTATALLPLGWAAVLAAMVHLYLWVRSARTRAPLHRELYTAAAIMLSCISAGAVLRAVPSGTALLGPGAAAEVGTSVLGIATFVAVNTALVGAAIALSSAGVTVPDVVGRWDENALEVAALSLGALLAAVLPDDPWRAVFVVAPLLLVQRAALVHHFEEAASRDTKTGLLNAGAWHNQADRALRRARPGRLLAVLVLDLDHFKDVNDWHGHLVGDEVLAAVAALLRTETREHDVVGRFGGEEFVALLDLTTTDELQEFAERLRVQVANLMVTVSTADGPLTLPPVTVSIGGALRESRHVDLITLLGLADRALYVAKRQGRNRVRVAPRGVHRSTDPSERHDG